MRRALVIAFALASLAVPNLAAAATTTTPSSAAGTASSPFSIGVPTPTEAETETTPTVVETSSTGSTNGSFTSLDWILVVAGVALVILGIIFYIGRDSRNAARHLRRGGLSGSAATTGVRTGTKPPPRSRKLSAQEKRRRKRGRAPRRR